MYKGARQAAQAKHAARRAANKPLIRKAELSQIFPTDSSETNKLPNHAKPRFEADYAISLSAGLLEAFAEDEDAFDNDWSWTGWIRRLWPAGVIRPGLLVYGFDLRRDQRRLRLLRRVLKGGAFSFRSMDQFVEEVKRLTGRTPDPDEDDDSAAKWPELEEKVRAVRPGAKCIGICATWEIVDKNVSIPLEGKFPRLGWVKLKNPNHGME